MVLNFTFQSAVQHPPSEVNAKNDSNNADNHAHVVRDGGRDCTGESCNRVGWKNASTKD